MREEIIFAGFGGQGIMVMGKVLSYAAMNYGKFVTWMPSYGAEVRGGTAHSMVVISDAPVPSPAVKEPSICVAMNSPSLQKFEDRIKQGGMLIINTSLVESKARRKDLDILEIPATDIASRLGNPRIGNMIILGAILSKKDILPIGYLIDALKEVFTGRLGSMISINERAVKEGYEYCSR